MPLIFTTNGRPFLRQVAEASGVWFLDARSPTNQPRPLESWYTPEGLKLLDSRIKQLELFKTPDEVEVQIDEFNRRVLTENFNKTV